ncbi:hypothetical protein AB7M74_001866 [Bradyrhizobium japonicum]
MFEKLPCPRILLAGRIGWGPSVLMRPQDLRALLTGPQSHEEAKIELIRDLGDHRRSGIILVANAIDVPLT